jgi:hypothetical protein
MPNTSVTVRRSTWACRRHLSDHDSRPLIRTPPQWRVGSRHGSEDDSPKPNKPNAVRPVRCKETRSLIVLLAVEGPRWVSRAVKATRQSGRLRVGCLRSTGPCRLSLLNRPLPRFDEVGAAFDRNSEAAPEIKAYVTMSSADRQAPLALRPAAGLGHQPAAMPPPRVDRLIGDLGG